MVGGRQRVGSKCCHQIVAASAVGDHRGQSAAEVRVGAVGRPGGIGGTRTVGAFLSKQRGDELAQIVRVEEAVGVQVDQRGAAVAPNAEGW